jgi:hypothetical protein
MAVDEEHFESFRVERAQGIDAKGTIDFFHYFPPDPWPVMD